MSAEEEALSQPAPSEPYVEMVDAFSPPSEPEKVWDGPSDTDNVRAAAEERIRKRRAEPEPIERNYVTHAPGTEEHHKPRPPNETISLKRASDDLSRQRNFEAEAIENAAKDATALEVDLTRLGADLAQQQQQQQPEPIAPQPVDPGIPPEVAELAAELERSPKLKAALEQEAVRIQQTQQEAAQARDNYANLAHQATQAAIFSMVAAFPEFAGLAPDQIQTGLQILRVQNPTRYGEAVQHLSRIDQLGKAATEQQQQQRQAQAAQVQQWALQQDSQMDAYLAKSERPEVVKTVKENVGRIAHQVYGIEPKALAQALQTTPALRSFEFQRLLYDATKYQLAQEGIEARQHVPVPVVQRPGVSQPKTSYADAEVAAARERFLKNPDDLRVAAAYLQAKRNARS